MDDKTIGEIMDFVFGFLAGIGTNFIFWLLISHVLTPRVEFSPYISKITTPISETDKSGYRYGIKIKNGGRRGIIDVQLRAILRVEGIGKKDSIELISIPLTPDGEKTTQIIRLPKVKPGVKSARTNRLYINTSEKFRTGSMFPDYIHEKAIKKELTLEDAMSLGNRAWLQLSVFGYDEFSGARKLFLSKEYTLDDIKDGSFEPKTLNIVKAPTQGGP